MNSTVIEIRGATFGYAAHVGRGILEAAGQLTRELVRGQRAVIITDSNVPRGLVERVGASLTAARFTASTIVVPAGENSKSLRQVERICDEMATLDRSSVVVGVGGGMVGDLSGFVAAIFHRGIPHVQIPTTLLAMVDSSIGGKTAVNLSAGKNLVGAFHHPILVIADLDALESLPERELRQGYAEIVKHAIIRDAEMFREMSSGAKSRDPVEVSSKLSRRDPSAPLRFARDDVELIARNIRIKAAIVAADERETSGERAVLNFGHTVGHAIERASDFRISHGDCVSLGMVAACDVSIKRAGLSAAERDEVIALLDGCGLPTRLPDDVSREKIIEAITRDKKFEAGAVRFVVTPRIGTAYLSRDVSFEDIGEAILHL